MGTFVGTPTLGATALIVDTDTAADFDHTVPEYMQATVAGLPTGASERSIKAWVKADSVLTGNYIVSYGVAGNGRAFNLTVETITAVTYVVFRHQGGAIRFPGISIGTPFHVVAVVPSGATTTDDVLVYIDGSLATGTRFAGSNQKPRPPGRPTYSSGPATPRPPALAFDGTLDEVAIYGVAVSAATALAHYNAGICTSRGADRGWRRHARLLAGRGARR